MIPAEARLGLPWCVSGTPEELHYCVADEPTENQHDWYSDDVDQAVPANARVTDRGDGVTVVMIDGEGPALLTTSKRCTMPRFLTKESR